jgi:NitT/TauT family transport system substrate-binding protein
VSAALAALALIGVAACGGTKSAAAPKAKELDKVTYLTGIGIYGREAYAWVAATKGYFKEQGIEVTIKPGAAGDSNLKLLAADQAQFAAIDFTGGIIQQGTGTAKDFRIIAGINQRTMLAVMAIEGSGITTPKDLEGRKVVETTGSVFGKLLPTYARLAGFDSTKVQWSGSTTAALPGLLASGKADAICLFVPGAPGVQAAIAPRKLVTLPWDQYITDLYGNALITSTKLAQNNPDLVKRFRTALLKGLEYSIDHPDETGDIIHKVQASLDPKIAAEEVRLMTPYVRGGPSIGALDQSRVAKSIAILQGAGAIPAGLTPDAVVDWSVVA